jgi:hypothetical protein
MKINLKLSKITISKLDNLNFKALENDQLHNLKGGGDTNITTVKVITIGGGFNDTTHLSSCEYGVDDSGNNDYGNCVSRQS